MLKPSNDIKPPGVCFSSTIEGCLESVPFYYTRDIDWKRRRKFVREGKNDWYVYTPAEKMEAIIPHSIDDYDRTKERRVVGRVKARLVSKIRVSIRLNKWKYKILK